MLGATYIPLWVLATVIWALIWITLLGWTIVVYLYEKIRPKRPYDYEKDRIRW